MNDNNNSVAGFDTEVLSNTVNIPIELYESMVSAYLLGIQINRIKDFTSAWAMLYNPLTSGVNLHVNVAKKKTTGNRYDD